MNGRDVAHFLTKGLKMNKRYRAAMPMEKPRLTACRRRVELQAGER
jgi:hypothetical protein